MPKPLQQTDEQRNEQRNERQPERNSPESGRIAQRAYERYQMRGGEHGRDQEDWFEAERELNNRAGE